MIPPITLPVVPPKPPRRPPNGNPGPVPPWLGPDVPVIQWVKP